MSDFISGVFEAITKLEADVAILTNNNEALERDDKVLRDHIEELEAENKRLKQGIENYLNGDYPHPRTYRPKGCTHGQNYYEECESCNDDHFQGILDSLTPEYAIKNEDES